MDRWTYCLSTSQDQIVSDYHSSLF
uniref:Uncharacterized protein n=1 Tax=Anguilla anguilla TaxID=7936 RepID=A0A0E9W723_ANGAN